MMGSPTFSNDDLPCILTQQYTKTIVVFFCLFRPLALCMWPSGYWAPVVQQSGIRVLVTGVFCVSAPGIERLYCEMWLSPPTVIVKSQPIRGRVA